MSHNYDIKMTLKKDTNQIKITISFGDNQREFDIMATKDGLDIKGNDTLIILPKGTNIINVDTIF